MTTHCSRCSSLMVPDAPLQFHSNAIDHSERIFSPVYRCVCCGNYIDQTILANRAKQAAMAVTNELVSLAA